MNETNIPYEISPEAFTTLSEHARNTSEHPEVESPETASTFINLLVPPVLITVGVTCNAMTIMTMRTKHFRKVSTSVYFKSGAMNDILALLISLTAHWLYLNLPDVYIRTDSSHVMCKFFNFYGSGNNDLGLLLTATMTAERAVAIASPFGATRYCTVKRAWKAVFGIIVFVVIKNCHFLLSSDMVPVGRTDRLCDTYPERIGIGYEIFLSSVWPWIHLAYVLLCGVAIVTSNSIILYYVHRSVADRQSGGQTWRHLVPMLIGESILLIALTFPFSLHLALLAVRLKYDATIYTDPVQAATETLIFNITFYMQYSNKCANFFMYCVTGSRFRDGLTFSLLSCCSKKKSKRLLSLSASISSTMRQSEKRPNGLSRDDGQYVNKAYSSSSSRRNISPEVCNVQPELETPESKSNEYNREHEPQNSELHVTEGELRKPNSTFCKAGKEIRSVESCHCTTTPKPHMSNSKHCRESEVTCPFKSDQRTRMPKPCIGNIEKCEARKETRSIESGQHTTSKPRNRNSEICEAIKETRSIESGQHIAMPKPRIVNSEICVARKETRSIEGDHHRKQPKTGIARSGGDPRKTERKPRIAKREPRLTNGLELITKTEEYRAKRELAMIYSNIEIVEKQNKYPEYYIQYSEPRNGNTYETHSIQTMSPSTKGFKSEHCQFRSGESGTPRFMLGNGEPVLVSGHGHYYTKYPKVTHNYGINCCHGDLAVEATQKSFSVYI